MIFWKKVLIFINKCCIIAMKVHNLLKKFLHFSKKYCVTIHRFCKHIFTVVQALFRRITTYFVSKILRFFHRILTAASVFSVIMFIFYTKKLIKLVKNVDIIKYFWYKLTWTLFLLQRAYFALLQIRRGKNYPLYRKSLRKGERWLWKEQARNYSASS